jgi:hypothetical protein
MPHAPVPCHSASGHGGCRAHRENAGTSSPQPLPENVKELGSGSLVEAQHARTVNMRIQHDLTVDLTDTEIADHLEPWIWQVVEMVRSSALTAAWTVPDLVDTRL